MKSKAKIVFWLGIAALVLSLPLIYIPKNAFTVMIPGSFNFLGIILLGEAATIKFRNFSLLKTIFKNWKYLLTFIAVAAINAVFLDGIVKYIGKLWIYPYWNTTAYFAYIIPAYFIYWLAVAESYLGLKAILDKARKGRKIITKRYKLEKSFYNSLGVIGFIALIFSLILIFLDYTNQNLPFFVSSEVFNNSCAYITPLGFIILMFFGFWFTFEFVEYNRTRGSLLKDILHGYFTPLIAIFAGAFITALIMEYHNLLIDGWSYVNWPLQNVQLFGLPILVLATWPLQYITFLSLFRLISPKESLEVWRGDLIK